MGAGFAINHFNGVTYNLDMRIQTSYTLRSMKGGDYNGKIAILVGHINAANEAIIVKGIHN